jgi:hypothetical protein
LARATAEIFSFDEALSAKLCVAAEEMSVNSAVATG